METSADIQQPTCTTTSLVKRAYSTRSPYKTQTLKSPKPKKVRRSRTGVETRGTT